MGGFKMLIAKFKPMYLSEQYFVFGRVNSDNGCGRLRVVT